MSGRGRNLGRTALLALLAVAAQAAAAGAQGPAVESATPDAVRQGDVMTLTGSGFRARAADHRAFLGGGGAAVWAEVVDAVPGRLVVEVGPVPAAGVEALTLWTGEGFDLPDTVLAAPERTWLLTGASWFVAAGEGGFAPITLLEPSEGTSGGRIEAGVLRVAVPPDPPPPPPCTPEDQGGFGCFEIEIKVVATSPPDPPPPTGGLTGGVLPARASASSSSAGLGVAASLTMRLMSAAAPPDPDAFAADVAQALGQVFGPLGLAAAADGPEVVVAYGGGVGDGSAVIALVPR